MNIIFVSAIKKFAFIIHYGQSKFRVAASLIGENGKVKASCKGSYPFSVIVGIKFADTIAALPTSISQTPVLADATAAALLALRPPTPVLADVVASARRVAVRAHPTYFAVLARFFEIRSEPGCF